MLIKVMQVLIALKFFDSELQLRHTEPWIKNKLMDLLTELTTLVLEFKKIQSDGKTPYSTFYLNSKVETIINKILMMYKGQEYKS